jgi:hypothetical protein
MGEDSTNLGQVIRIDDERVRDYLRAQSAFASHPGVRCD